MCLVYGGITPSFDSSLTPNALGAFFCKKNNASQLKSINAERVGRDSASAKIFFRKFCLATASRSRSPECVARHRSGVLVPTRAKLFARFRPNKNPVANKAAGFLRGVWDEVGTFLYANMSC